MQPSLEETAVVGITTTAEDTMNQLHMYSVCSFVIKNIEIYEMPRFQKNAKTR